MSNNAQNDVHKMWQIREVQTQSAHSAMTLATGHLIVVVVVVIIAVVADVNECVNK